MANPLRAGAWDAEDAALDTQFDLPTVTASTELVHGARQLSPATGPKREFNDRVSTLHEFEAMPDEYRALLTRVLRIQADCEIGGPHLYVSNWVLTAPTADDQWRMSRIAAHRVER